MARGDSSRAALYRVSGTIRKRKGHTEYGVHAATRRRQIRRDDSAAGAEALRTADAAEVYVLDPTGALCSRPVRHQDLREMWVAASLDRHPP